VIRSASAFESLLDPMSETTVRTELVIADTTALIEVRRFVRLSGIPEPLLMPALLLASELVFTCLRHVTADGNSIELSVRVFDDRVRMDVAREGVSHLLVLDDAEVDETGLGLEIVASLAHRWGVGLEGSVWRAWFELRAPR
jgi:hypothetical protein